MKSIVRVAVLVAAFATAGCVSNAEVAQVAVAAAAETTPVYGDMHAATTVQQSERQRVRIQLTTKEQLHQMGARQPGEPISFSASGGERGIRTPGTDNRTTDFESAAFDHSAISPRSERKCETRILSGGALDLLLPAHEGT
jgi:hypothetical protein